MKEKCSFCNGEGSVVCDCQLNANVDECLECDGTGENLCLYCNGTGEEE